MDFGLTEDERELFGEASRLIAKRCAVTDARRILNGGAFDRAFWEELGELGWLSVAVPEEFGGAGLSYGVLCGVAYELGRVLSPAPITSSIFLALELFVLGGTEAQKQQYVPELASGRRIATLALAEHPGPLTVDSVGCTWADGKLTGTKHAVADAEIADTAIVLARTSEGAVGLFIVHMDDPNVAIKSESSIDPSRRLSAVVFDGAKAEPLGTISAGWETLQRGFDRAAVLIAFQQIGGAQVCLETARDYALIRRAFGRQIGSFQAVKHILSDVYIAVELASANALHASTMMQSCPQAFRKAAAAARLSATAAFERAARDSIQTHGGIGVTWEHDANLFYRRSRYLAGLLGGAAEWRDRLATELVSEGGNTQTARNASSEQSDAEEFRTEVRKWVSQEAPKYEPPAHINERSPELLELARQWQIAKHQAGYAAFMWPEALGGHASSKKQITFMQEQGRYKLPPTAFFVGTDVVIPALLYYDEKAHLERFAGPAIRAEQTWCELFSEPGAGSDLAGIRTRAERDGTDWIINGQKVWNSFAQWADWAMIVVRTDPKVPKHKGLTMFLMDMKTPGIEVRPLRTINGDEEFNEVFLTDVRIPDANRLAGVGDGWKVFMWTLLTERIGNAGDPAVGRNLIKAMLKLANTTDPASGKRLIENSEMRSRIADYYADVSAVGLIHARMVDELAAGKVAGPESGIGKMVLSSRLQEMGAFSIDLAGITGLVGEDSFNEELAEIQDGFLSAPGYRVGGGTDQILRNLIAEQVLGLPREERTDKDMPFDQLEKAVG